MLGTGYREAGSRISNRSKGFVFTAGLQHRESGTAHQTVTAG
jgi:hypothetical protein